MLLTPASCTDIFHVSDENNTHTGSTMKINGNKVDTTGIKFRTKVVTCDPVQYEAIATTVINGVSFTGDYCGDSDEGRPECKQGAYLSLRASCKKVGIII